METPKSETPKSETQKLEEYSSYKIPSIKDAYISLLNDNLIYLITFIYNNKTHEPYNNIEYRIALSLQLMLSSNKLLPSSLTAQIVKDLDFLKQNDDYLNKFKNKMQKVKVLNHEIQSILKHTEFDDSISLNMPTDLASSVSTLNSSSASKPSVVDKISNDNCSLQ